MVILPPKHVLNLLTSLPLHECHISKVTISCHLNDFRSLLPHPRTASPALFSIRSAISQLSPHTLLRSFVNRTESKHRVQALCIPILYHIPSHCLDFNCSPLQVTWDCHILLFLITELVQMLAPPPKTFFLPFLLILHILNPPSLPHSVTRSHTSAVLSTLPISCKHFSCLESNLCFVIIGLIAISSSCKLYRGRRESIKYLLNYWKNEWEAFESSQAFSSTSQSKQSWSLYSESVVGPRKGNKTQKLWCTEDHLVLELHAFH